MRSDYIPPLEGPQITPADDMRLTAEEASPCPCSRLPPGSPRRLPPVPSLPPRVVGREAELVYLHERWGKALDGARQVVFLSGEAGIGKTTLTEAFVASLPSQPDVWIGRGQCVESYGAGEAYLPVLEAMGRLGREPGKDAVMTVFAQYAPTWLAQLPALVPAAERAGLERVLADATRARMLRELVDALEILSAQQLLILVLEDLQWSDPSTVEFLAYLLRRQGRARLFLIGTYRPTEILAADHPLKRVVQELQGRGHCEVLPLELLPEEAVAAYLRARFGAVPMELAKLIHQRTDGNPLFMVATAEHLLRAGVIVAEGAHVRVTLDLTALHTEVPESLRQLIEKQLEELNPEEQCLLKIASVAGAEFAVATLAPEVQRPVETLEEHCANLAQRGQFLRAAGVEHAPDGLRSGRYSFVHALYQRVIYERIAEARRMQLHARLGKCKEQRYGERAPELASELAVHFAMGGDGPRALHYFTVAGETAMRRHAHHEAIRHLTQGIEVLHTLPATSERTQHELTLHLALGIPLIATQGWAAPPVGQVYSHAHTLCQQLGTTPQLFPVLRGLQLFAMTRTEYTTARHLAEQLLCLAQHLHDPALLVGAHLAMGQTLFFLGEFPRARMHLEQGLALHPQQHTYPSWAGGHPGIQCLGYAAWTLWFLGYPEQALHMSQEALRLARDWGQPFTLAMALQFLANLHHVRREAQATQEHAEETIALATTQGFTSFVAIETLMRGWARAEQGQRAEGTAEMHDILGTWRTAGMDFTRPFFLGALADLYGKMGQHDEGIRVLAEAFALVAGNGECQYEAELYRLYGELLLRADDMAPERHAAPRLLAAPPCPQFSVTTSEEAFRKALAIAQHQHAKSLELRAAMSLARLWRTQKKEVEARHLLETVYGWFTEGFDTPDLQDARALLLALGGTVTRTEAEPCQAEGETQEADHGATSAPGEAMRGAAWGASRSCPTPLALTIFSRADPHPPAHFSTPASPRPSQFRREGEYWTLVFHGTVARLKDTRGMHYLARLLQHPGHELSALALAADAPDCSIRVLPGTRLCGEARDSAAALVQSTGFTDAGAVLDPHAIAAYRQRLTELQDEIEEASALHDIGRVEKLQTEHEFVMQELVGAVGLGGRARKAASPQEHARVNVTRAIRTAIARVTEVQPALGQHLALTIKTGTFCLYAPDPSTALSWQF